MHKCFHSCCFQLKVQNLDLDEILTFLPKLALHFVAMAGSLECRGIPPHHPLFVYKGTSLTFVWKTGSIHLFNCFQNRPLDAENLRHLLPMCCFHKPHHTLFMPPVSQQSTTNNNFSPFFPSVSQLHAVFLPTH